MCLISLSSICPPYRNRSNYSNINEDAEISQPLVDRAQTDISSTTTDQLLTYIREEMDPKGRVECGLSIISTAMAIIILSLHALENYHENHKEILGAQILNVAIITSVCVKRILSGAAFLIICSKKAVNWHQSRRLSESGIGTENLSIIQQLMNHCGSTIDDIKHFRDPNSFVYNTFQLACFVMFLESFYLHLTEKEHENHKEILALETMNAMLSCSLTFNKIRKTAAKNRQQPSLLPQSSIRMRNYQAIS